VNGLHPPVATACSHHHEGSFMVVSNCQSESASADATPQNLFFPRPLPQETLYSIGARFTAANSLSSDKASMYLLGHRRGGFHHEIPHGLSRLEYVSGGELQATQDLLKSRTVLSCILPFMSAQRRRAMLERMLVSVVPQSPTSLLGMSWRGHDAHHSLRRCPDCASQDAKRFGFSYWHTEHQLLGVWTCPFHGRPLQWLSEKYRQKFNWRQAEREECDFCETTVQAATLMALDKLAKVILWTSSMQSLNTTVLNIMVRARLRRANLVHTEIKLTNQEMQFVHETLAGPLAHTGIAHFTRFTSADWIKELLVDPRASHPLRWALLIASTLGSDFYQSECRSAGNAVKSTDEVKALLNREYQNALERTPQPPLFKSIYRPRISRAPDSLYRALGEPMGLKEAAAYAGLSLNEAMIWVRRDKMLAKHWHKAIGTARIHEATETISGYLSMHPSAQRIDVLRAHLSSIRLLERYDPESLQSLLPASWSKFNWPPMLPFGE
jgi:hypothetical protein